MDCQSVEQNKEFCTCTYGTCARKGKCCECVRYHVRMKELPACAFSPEAEATYDRSFARFVEDQT